MSASPLSCVNGNLILHLHPFFLVMKLCVFPPQSETTNSSSSHISSQNYIYKWIEYWLTYIWIDIDDQFDRLMHIHIDWLWYIDSLQLIEHFPMFSLLISFHWHDLQPCGPQQNQCKYPHWLIWYYWTDILYRYKYNKMTKDQLTLDFYFLCQQQIRWYWWLIFFWGGGVLHKARLHH